MVGHVLAGGAILRFGTPEQQATHLRPTLSADRLWCQLFCEPGAGSDLGSLTTRADLDGDHYVVNGQKVWCSGGRYSDWGILMARTDPRTIRAASTTASASSCSRWTCPASRSGPLRQMTGEAEFDEVFFTDVELPAEHLLGPLHGGWGVGMAVLTNERGHIGTAVIGLERRLEQLAAIADAGGHGDDGGGLEPIGRQQLARLLARGQRLQGDGATPGSGRVDRGVADEARDHRDDVRRGDAARRPRRRRAVPSTVQGHLACWRHPAEGSPAARARSSATSSANVCSGCRGNPNRDRRQSDQDGRHQQSTQQSHGHSDREVRIVNMPVDDDTSAS